MSLRPTSSRLLALLLGWALVLPVTGVTPTAAATPPSPGSVASSPTGPGTEGADTELDGEAVSLLDGLDLTVADIDPESVSVVAGEGAGTGIDVTASPEQEEEPAPDPAAVLRRPTPADRAKVEPAVAETVDQDGAAAVIIELTGSADLAALEAEADRAGLEAAAEVREQARAFDRGSRERAAEAADVARGRTVVETLRQTGADQRAALIADLAGSGVATDTTTTAGTDADDDTRTTTAEPVDLWVVNSVGATVDADTLAELETREDVAHVRLEAQVELPEITSEPALPTWSLEKVNAPLTWGDYGHRGEGVTIAVLDTGVAAEHPALAGQYRGRDGDHSDSWFVTTGENYPLPGDGNGHGTHVAGSIAGGAPGDVIGVAPDAEWIGVKILTDGGRGGEIGILSGMQWVMAPGGDPAKAPDIASNSWGSGPGQNAAFWDAVAAWRAAGIVPVFANGNDGPINGSVGNPGGYPHSIGVGATDVNDAIASFSSRGPATWAGEQYLKPQVSAPGAAIYSAWPQDLSESGYHTISGTSMATPHVSGVAALVLSANPGLGVDELQTLLEETARTETFMGQTPNNAYGHGIVDAHAATTRAAHSGLVSGAVTGPDGPVAATVSVVDGPSTVADAQTGAYELYAAPGTLTVRVSAYGYQTQEHTVELARNGHLQLDVSLSTQAEATLTGTVTAGGAPVGDAHVSVVGQRGSSVVTDVDGGYALPVPHGTHELRIAATGHSVWTGEVDVDGDTVQDVELTPLPLAGVETWPGLKGSAAGHGLAATDLDGESLQQQWATRVDAVMFGSPAADDSGVYQLSANGALTALDPTTGEVRWTATTGGTQRGTPALSPDGETVYVTTGNEATLAALSADDGSVLWTYDLGADIPTYGAPAVVDGTVYVSTGSGDTGSVHAVDATTGEGLWSTPITGGVFFGPSVGDGVAIASSVADGTVTALDAATGDVLWQRTDTIAFTAAAIAGGRAYLGTTNAQFTGGSVLALDTLTGETLWETGGHGDSQGNSPVLYDDLVILGSHTAGSVLAYDAATGELVWSHFAGAAVTSSVAVTTGGVVLGGSQGFDVFALDATTGEQLWTDSLPAAVLSSTAVSDDAALFVARDGTVTAYRSAGGVSGTVTGPDGPVEARVELVGTDHVTTSDAETGAFELRAPAGDYTLRISRYGLSTHTQDVTVSPTSPVTVAATLTAVGDGALTGTVSDEVGAPLPGASVTLDGAPLDPVLTGEDGTFELAAVAAGSWQLQVDLAGYAAHVEEVVVEAGATATVEITLSGFDLAVVADYNSQLSDVLRSHGWGVDELSFAEAALAPERYDVMILNGRSGDYARDNKDAIAALLEGADAGGTSIIALDTWGAVGGSVDEVLELRGSNGRLESAYGRNGTVWLTDPVEHPITAPIDRTRYPILRDDSHAWLVGYEGGNLATLGSDQQGPRGSGIGYERTSPDSVQVLLPSHSASVLVGPGKHWVAGAEEIFVAAVEHALSAEFGTVALTVTGPDGTAVAAEVSVPGSFEHEELADGTGELLLPDGTFTLLVDAPGMRPLEQEVTVTLGGTTPLHVVLEASDAGAISGTVTDDAGDPVPGASVAVDGVDPVTTSPDGGYSIPHLDPGTYTVAVTAEGYLPAEVPDVEVSAGSVTDVDVELVASPAVAVVGDYSSRLTDLLTAAQVRATAVGWEVLDDLDAYDVVVLNNPPSVPDQQWLDNFAALDAAGVSVVFPAANGSTSTRGIHKLSDVTGNPSAVVRHGGFRSSAKELTEIVEHPITAGLGEEPVIYLNAGSDAPWFEGYQGVTLATVGMDGVAAGPGVAYDVRTPDSVHVLLSGLFANAGTETDVEWAEPGRQLFLDAVRYAAAPRLAQVSGSVTDPDGAPVAAATVSVEGRAWSATTGDSGEFLLGLPDGEHTLEVSAFGYLTHTQQVSVIDGAAHQLEVVLELGDVGALEGTVTGSALPGTGLPADQPGTAAEGTPLEGAVVRIVGTALETVTDEQGRYSFPLVLAGERELEVEADGYIRTLHDFDMPEGAHTEDVPVLESARVAVIADSTSGVHSGRLDQFLTDWGYQPVDVDYTDVAALADVDMAVVNHPSYAADGLPAFLDQANRNDLPVVWTGNYARGAIRNMPAVYGNPEEWVQGTLDGTVTTTVTADHPLTAGLPETFSPTAHNRMYGGFTGYSGTTVATIASEDGPAGDTIAYDGRTAGSVDVLLSTNGAGTYGAVGTRDLPEFYFTPETSRSLTNALQWALTADGLGADTRGTIVSADGPALEGTVTVEETGRTYPARAGDGGYVIPLDPGTWTLTASAFGHVTTSTTVTVEQGQSLTSAITLPVTPGGPVQGTVLSPAGLPVEGAEVVVEGTEYAATTGADGRFAFAHLPEGDWVVVARAEGMVTDFVDVTVPAGGSVTAEARLGEPAHLALVGDHFSGSMGTFLSENGYTAESFTYRELDQVDVTTGTYDMVFLNANGLAPTAEVLTGFLDEAAAHDVPVVLPSQFNSGAIRHLASYLGDPESVDNDFEPESAGYLVGVEHPVFDGYDVGETVTLLRNPGTNQQFQSFAGYSGTVLADIVHPETGTVFDHGVAYRFASPGSVHLLLSSLGASSYGSPVNRWTFDAERITLNGVAWAMEARQSSVVGTVTDGEVPVEGAEVTVAGTATRTVTAADGAYEVGVAAGEVTLEVRAAGYEPYTATVTVGSQEALRHDVALTPLAESSLTVSVVDDTTREPVAGAQVSVDGPTDTSVDSGEDGNAVLDPVLVGDYTVTVEGPNHVVATTEVTVGPEPASLTVEVSTIRVGVLGDVRGDLTDFLVEEGVPSEEVTWAAVVDDLDDYRAVVVNGGRPSDEQFAQLVAEADEAQVDLLFTGTYGVTEGGIRLLEAHDEAVAVGGQGYRDGAVGLTDLAEHPVLAGVTDPAGIVADDGYYSWLSGHRGDALATLTVGGEPVGTAVAFEQRTELSGHLLLSFAAVSDYMGPDRGWTGETEQVMVDALEWLLLAPPSTPTLETDATLVGTATVQVSGTAYGADEVRVTRGGDVLGTATPADDGTWSATVVLDEGPNELVAVAVNEMGSTESEPLVITVDLTPPTLRWSSPADGSLLLEPVVTVRGTVADELAEPVSVTVQGEPVAVTGDGSFTVDVALEAGVQDLTVEATDAVGHTTTQTRQVLHQPLAAEWNLTGSQGKTQRVKVVLTDGDGVSTRVDGAALELLQDDEVVETFDLRWASDEYLALVRGVPSGRYDLRLVLELDGFTGAVDGPELRMR